jgi:hypothetical protein
MLVEAYFTALNTCIVYGRMECWLVTSFVTALIVFAFSGVITHYARKKEYEFNWVSRLLATYALLFAAWIFELVYYGVRMDEHLFFPLLPGLGLFLLFVQPAALAYSKTLKKYPHLPWHLTQFFYCLLASLVLWGLAIFWFGLFTVDPFITL